jgi:hypothetical protein
MPSRHRASALCPALQRNPEQQSRRLFINTLGAFLIVDWPGPLSADQAKLRLSVVVAKNLPLTDLSIKDLRNLYKGDKILGPNGKQLIPLALPIHSPERTAFDYAVLSMSPELVASYWIDRKIRGQSGAPKSIESSDLLLRVVSKLEGAVGFVRDTDLRDSVHGIRIDGKLPIDPSYPVQA